MLYSKRFTAAALSFIFAIAFTSLLAGAESITTDTTIDDSSPLNGTKITVSDGIGGPTTVRVVEGGSVAGFELQEASHLILDGGDVTFLSTLTDNSTFTLLSGSLGCLDPVCSLIDYNTLISASGNSAIVLKGITGVDFTLQDNSTLTIFGTDLAMFDFDFNGEITVLDGSEFVTRISLIGDRDPDGRIILHEVPEPTGATLLISSLSILSFSIRRKHCHFPLSHQLGHLFFGPPNP